MLRNRLFKIAIVFSFKWPSGMAWNNTGYGLKWPSEDNAGNLATRELQYLISLFNGTIIRCSLFFFVLFLVCIVRRNTSSQLTLKWKPTVQYSFIYLSILFNDRNTNKHGNRHITWLIVGYRDTNKRNTNRQTFPDLYSQIQRYKHKHKCLSRSI